MIETRKPVVLGWQSLNKILIIINYLKLPVSKNHLAYRRHISHCIIIIIIEYAYTTLGLKKNLT